MSKKNDWEIVYNSIYYDLQSKYNSKIGKKNDWRVIYKTIYYNLQSKIDWKMSEKMTQKMK